MPDLAGNPPIKPVSLLAKRWLMCAALVFGIYNPSGRSYYHWVRSDDGSLPLKVMISIFLFAATAAVVRMAFASMGYRGVVAILSLIFGSILFRVGLGWFEFEQVDITTYTILLWISTILGVGISWSFFQRRLSGEKYVLKTPP